MGEHLLHGRWLHSYDRSLRHGLRVEHPGRSLRHAGFEPPELQAGVEAHVPSGRFVFAVEDAVVADVAVDALDAHGAPVRTRVLDVRVGEVAGRVVEARRVVVGSHAFLAHDMQGVHGLHRVHELARGACLSLEVVDPSATLVELVVGRAGVVPLVLVALIEMHTILAEHHLVGDDAHREAVVGSVDDAAVEQNVLAELAVLQVHDLLELFASVALVEVAVVSPFIGRPLVAGERLRELLLPRHHHHLDGGFHLVALDLVVADRRADGRAAAPLREQGEKDEKDRAHWNVLSLGLLLHLLTTTIATNKRSKNKDSDMDSIY